MHTDTRRARASQPPAYLQVPAAHEGGSNFPAFGENHNELEVSQDGFDTHARVTGKNVASKISKIWTRVSF